MPHWGIATHNAQPSLERLSAKQSLTSKHRAPAPRAPVGPPPELSRSLLQRTWCPVSPKAPPPRSLRWFLPQSTPLCPVCPWKSDVMLVLLSALQRERKGNSGLLPAEDKKPSKQRTSAHTSRFGCVQHLHAVAARAAPDGKYNVRKSASNRLNFGVVVFNPCRF